MVWRTTFITLSTCFLLGTTFTHWIVDHDILWKTPLTSEALEAAIEYYSYLSAAPKGLGWVYIAVGAVLIVSLGGRSVKGFRGSGGEVLFDGGSAVLATAITYTQVAEVYPTITLFPSPLPNPLRDHPLYPALSTAVRDLATENVMTAVMLTGIMLLQAGRYYAKRPSSSLPPTVVDSNASTPARVPSPDVPPSPISQRAATPYRELTEAEALELNSVEKKAPGRRRVKKLA